MLVALRLRYTQPARLKPYALFILGVAVLTFVLIASNTYEFMNTLVMQSAAPRASGAMTEINDQSGGLVLFPWTLVPSFLPMLFGLHPFGIVGVDPLISIQIVAGRGPPRLFRLAHLEELHGGRPGGLPRGRHAHPRGLPLPEGPGLRPLQARDVGPAGDDALHSPRRSSRFLWSRTAKVQRRARVGARRVSSPAPSVSQIYYSYSSLGTFGGGLTEVVKGSALGVGFTPPKNLKYQGIESDISNVVSAKMLSMYTQGTDTRFLSRSYMDNIANIAVLKFLRTEDPDLGPQARLVEKLSLLRFMLPPELLEDDIPDYRVVTIHREANSVLYANNWTETSSRHLNYNDRLFISIRTDLDHFNKWNNGHGLGRRRTCTSTSSRAR